MSEERPVAPVARRRPHLHVAHGIYRIDDYHWLTADPSDPAVARHIDAENAYADAMMRELDQLAARLVAEAEAREIDDPPVPWQKGRHEYRWEATPEGLSVLRRRRVGGTRWRVVLDEAAEIDDPDGYVHFGEVAISPDDSWIAYTVDQVGAEEHELRLKRIATGETCVVAGKVAPFVCFGPDASTLYFGRTSRGRVASVWRWRDGAVRCVLRGRADEHLWFSRCADGSRIVIVGARTGPSRAWALDAGDPTARPYRLTEVVVRQPDRLSCLEHHPGGGGRWWAVDCSERADGQVVSFREGGPIDIRLPVRPRAIVDGLAVWRRHLVICERENLRRRLRVVPLDHAGRPRGRGFVRSFRPTQTVSPEDNHGQFHTETLRYRVESPIDPPEEWELNLRSGAARRLARTTVAGYRRGAYRVDLVWVDAPDGARIPVIVVRSRRVRQDGKAPAIVYGYGAYSDYYEPEWSLSWLGLLDRGVVLALAGVRGGGELGAAWHDAGRRDRKEQSFRDFVTVVRALTAAGFCSPRRVVARGDSAGGLLMGWLANNAGSMFCGICAGVPFVDAVTAMSDPSRALVTGEYSEWGDPNRSVEQMARMLAWSPYDNVTARRYPPMLVVTAWHDRRVPVGEPLKWVARLRAHKLDRNPLVLRVHRNEGHGVGVSAHRALVRECEWYAFALAAAGVEGRLPEAEPAAAARTRPARTGRARLAAARR